MSAEIWVALISGAATVVATVLTVVASNHRTQNVIQVNQAVTETRLESLTNEVRKHNNFAEKIPQIETRIEYLEKDIQDLKGAK